MEEPRKTSELKEVTSELVGWGDNRLFRTLRLLTTRPGYLISDFCEGEKQKYVSPVVYFFGVAALEAYVAKITGFYDFMLKTNVDSLREQFSDPAFAKSSLDVSAVPEKMNDALAFMFSETGQKMIILPIAILFTWLLYRSHNRSFKANSWFALYTFAHLTLLSIPLLLLWYFTKASLAVYTTPSLLIGSVYWIWSSMQFYKIKLGKAILKRIVLMIVFLLVVNIVFLVLAFMVF